MALHSVQLLCLWNPCACPRAGSPSHQQWSSQRQKAAALLLFGLVVGCLCTRATLLAVREEGEVVSLAVELAQKEQKARAFPTPSARSPELSSWEASAAAYHALRATQNEANDNLG